MTKDELLAALRKLKTEWEEMWSSDDGYNSSYYQGVDTGYHNAADSLVELIVKAEK